MKRKNKEEKNITEKNKLERKKIGKYGNSLPVNEEIFPREMS